MYGRIISEVSGSILLDLFCSLTAALSRATGLNNSLICDGFKNRKRLRNVGLVTYREAYKEAN